VRRGNGRLETNRAFDLTMNDIERRFPQGRIDELRTRSG